MPFKFSVYCSSLSETNPKLKQLLGVLLPFQLLNSLTLALYELCLYISTWYKHYYL